jgi:hypothetical protein
MKTDIWPEESGMLQMSDWLAELRDDGDTGKGPAARPAGPVGTHEPPPEPSAAAAANRPTSRVEIFAAEAHARAQAWADVQASARAKTVARADARARVPITERAVIGDELRMPIMWCEMGSCISWHADPAALGEADIRARAIAAGWRIDALARLACPQCQQSNGQFWATHAVRLSARDTATAVLPAAAGSEGGADAECGAKPGTIPAAARAIPMVEPALQPLPVQEWQEQKPVSHSAVFTD